jgi:hypothetical protein
MELELVQGQVPVPVRVLEQVQVLGQFHCLQ